LSIGGSDTKKIHVTCGHPQRKKKEEEKKIIMLA
jgi:hypothetical protein